MGGFTGYFTAPNIRNKVKFFEVNLSLIQILIGQTSVFLGLQIF